MSIINQMLKDLDKRELERANQQKQQAEMPPGLTTPKNESLTEDDKLRKHIVAIIVLLVISGSGYWWFKPTTVIKESASKATVVKKIKEEIIPEKKQMPVFAEAATLQDITTSFAENQTELEIVLSHHVHYQLHMNHDHSLLTLILSHTSLPQSLPEIGDQNGIIKKLVAERVKDGLELRVALLPNTQVGYLEYNKATGNKLSLILVNDNVVKSKQQDKEVLRKNLPLTPEEKMAEDYQVALNLIAQDHFQQAADQLKLLVKQHSGFVAARRTLAALLIREKKYLQAKRCLQEGLAITPDAVELLELYARVLIVQGRYKQAATVLHTAQPDLAQAPEYYALMAAVQRHLGNYLVAAHLYEQLINMDSENAAWWLGFGVALDSAGKTNAAVEAYKRALSADNLAPALRAYLQAKLQQLGG